MPRRISRLGGTTLRRSFMTNAYSPAMIFHYRGSERRSSPIPPTASELRALDHQATVLGHHAAILHHVDAGARELGGRAVVADPELEPHRARTPWKRQDLARVAGQELRPPEHVNDVD